MTIPSLKPRIATLDTRQGSSAAVERIRGYKLTKIRERVLLRDGYACRDCGRASIHLEIHHDHPLHLGGQETDANRVSLCKACHAKRTEREEKERLSGGCFAGT
jgi:5-methylcytosine-specific restriction protein A